MLNRCKVYLKLTDACQTKARSKKKTGMIGKTSTIGSKGAYASGNFAINKVIKSKHVKAVCLRLCLKSWFCFACKAHVLGGCALNTKPSVTLNVQGRTIKKAERRNVDTV